MHKPLHITGISTIFRDIRAAVRYHLRHWPTTAFAVLTLGIGAGGVAVLSSLISSVVFSPLPFPSPGELVAVTATRHGTNQFVTPWELVHWRADNKVFKTIAAKEDRSFTLTSSGHSRQLRGSLVTDGYLTMFGVAPALGRAFTPNEMLPPQQHFVVISNRLWHSQFGGRNNVIGSYLTLDRTPYTVIGVMPPGFQLGPNAAAFWAPFPIGPQEMHWRGGVLQCYGRLKEGVSLKEAQSAMTVLASQLRQQYPTIESHHSISVIDLKTNLVGKYYARFWVFGGAVWLLFLVACANVASLVLARSTSREQELAVRVALGATRWRILRQFLIEGLLLGAAGSLTGFLIAVVMLRVVKALYAPTIPLLGHAQIGIVTTGVLICLAVLSAVLSSAWPGYRITSSPPTIILGARAASGGTHSAVRRIYVAAESCLAVILLLTASVFIQSAIEAGHTKLGFATSNIITGKTELPIEQYGSASKVAHTYEAIREALANQPGVQDAAVASRIPLGESSMGVILKQYAVTPPLRSATAAALEYVSPNYFATIREPILSGRVFNSTDQRTSFPAAIVNQALARQIFPNKDAINKLIRLPDLNGTDTPLTVVGVVADAKDNGPLSAAVPTLYIPITQVPTAAWSWTQRSMYLVARVKATAFERNSVLRDALNRVDSGLPLGDELTMNERISGATRSTRLAASLLSAVGLGALLLTVVGIFGIVSYFVTSRRTEIGIRLALGANRLRLIRAVLWSGMVPVIVGLTAGAAVGLYMQHILTASIYGMSNLGLMTLFAALASFVVAALIACLIPACHAATIDPVSVIRNQ